MDDPIAQVVAELSELKEQIATLKSELDERDKMLTKTQNALQIAEASVASFSDVAAQLAELKAIYQAPLPLPGGIDQVTRFRTSDGVLHEKIPDANDHEATLVLMDKGRLNFQTAQAVIRTKEKLRSLIMDNPA